MRSSLLVSLFVAITFAQEDPIVVTPYDELADFIKPFAQSLININDSTLALDASLKTFTGTDQVVGLLADSQALLKTIRDETTAVQPLPSLEGQDIEDVIDLGTYVVNLGYYVDLTVSDLVGKKDIFESACVGPIVLQQIEQQSSAADVFQSLVIAKLPSSLQDIGTTLASTIPVALASGVAAYADQTTLPASCSATTTTTTSVTTSTSATTGSGSTTTATGASTSYSASTYSTQTGPTYSTGGGGYYNTSTVTTKYATSTYATGASSSSSCPDDDSTYSTSAYSTDAYPTGAHSTSVYPTGTSSSSYEWEVQSSLLGPNHDTSSVYTTGSPYSSASGWSAIISSSSTQSTYTSVQTTNVSPAHPITPSYGPPGTYASTYASSTEKPATSTSILVGTYTGAASFNNVNGLAAIIAIAGIPVAFL